MGDYHIRALSTPLTPNHIRPNQDRKPSRMTLPPDSTITQTHSEEEAENNDPFVTTPPRKTKTQASKPATLRSKANTPLHKRFLEEVTMSPGTTCTPPRTPSRSPTRNKKAGNQTLEVGQNGFYFSMEIPERKIVASRPASRAATPDVKTGRVTPSPEKRIGRLTPGTMTPGRLSPSPKKESKSEVKDTPTGGGRVRDILRKNLFGTPTKKVTKPGRREGESSGVNMSPSKDRGCQLQMTDGSGDEKTLEAAAGIASTQSVAHKPGPSAQPTASLSNSFSSPALQNADMSPTQDRTPEPAQRTAAPSAGTAGTAPQPDPRKVSASTPSNIGHLMANHSNKGAKVQALPATGGTELMPTPLRKMQEKLSLSSPYALRKEKSIEVSDTATTQRTGTTMPPVSTLAHNLAAMAGTTSLNAQACDRAERIPIAPSKKENAARKQNRLLRLLPSPITTPIPVMSSRSDTATTPSFPSPLSPSRPGLSSRSKSFGTPAHLRSSMQEDMFKVQESLKRSLGQEVFEKAASRPTTPMSPSAATSRPSTAATNRSTNRVKPAIRPLSVVGPPKPNATGTTQAVPRKPLTTAARKPRPKSMIVGSAKVLETLASQIDSPRERAKLRSTGAAAPIQQNKAAVPRPSTAPWMSRGSTQAATTRKPVGTQPTARTTKSPGSGGIYQPKRVTLPTPTAEPGPVKQRVVSAEVIADRVAAWNKEDSQQTAPKPVARFPVRTKSVKTLTKPDSKPAVKPAPKSAASPGLGRVSTPEPKAINNDSGTAESFTPPGFPTQLPMSPSKKLLVAPTTPAPSRGADKDARKQRLQKAHRNAPPNNVRNDHVGASSAAAQLRAARPVATPGETPANKRHTWVGGLDEEDPNRYRTPSREVQSRLDEAIDRKIQEDRRAAGWI
ncbi:hypothetical protein E8E12_004428 [Didymella heteroderae]|uniref:Uncharacterized protein n=1 Tax=Didymella heteroderae TaxID=1769908 RepID=A0A9P4WKZ9_9PLEO|nr:hypothetical protein E8E12_004428 [Didymella heteroderae]